MSHANRGIAWQRALEGWHDAYRRGWCPDCGDFWRSTCGHPSPGPLAVIHPCPPRVKVLGKVSAQGRFSACFAGDGPPDYAGTIRAFSGRGVSFDAKSCAADRWPLASLELHQARDLEATMLAGGLAFVALLFEADGSGWVLPWARLGPAYWAWSGGRSARGEASIARADVGTVGLEIPDRGDWLRAVVGR